MVSIPSLPEYLDKVKAKINQIFPAHKEEFQVQESKNGRFWI
jgi:hypothetical protein